MQLNKASKNISVSDVKESIDFHSVHSIGATEKYSCPETVYKSIALTLRDRLIEKMLATQEKFDQDRRKKVYYLSMEFLLGRCLKNNLCNLKTTNIYREATKSLGYELDQIAEIENDPALGNGGLGRLAACFIDSMATLGLAGYGYGINYEFGLFKQVIRNGYQVEKPDHWASNGSVWQIERPELSCIVPIYGNIDHFSGRDGETHSVWMNWKHVIGVPYDMPIVGYGGKVVNYLRLYSARSSDEFDIQIFNQGDYIKAIEEKLSSEVVSKVLYPDDTLESGKELRLIQEYFFISCAIQDAIRKHLKQNLSLKQLPKYVSMQLNDTHPALAIAELMRLLLDVHDFGWDQAWKVSHGVFAYTNHTLMPEALEKWSVYLMEKVLPRHLEIIYEINTRFLNGVVEKKWPGDDEKKRELSIIQEGDEKFIRMANLAIVGSHSVNGVSELHSNLVKKELVPDFYDLFPKKFNNKTNGITQRRWLLLSNPKLADLITESIGDQWITDLYHTKKLKKYVDDSSFKETFYKIKQENKVEFAELIKQQTGIDVDPCSVFDVHAKRIHEYKRQMLTIMGAIDMYLRIKNYREFPKMPHTYIFSGKAAPGYWVAKQVIKLINSVAQIVNNDPIAKNHLKIVFMPNYNVSLAEKMISSSDINEQVSTAGYEASGTGNMKFCLNGSLIVGTLDGANIEIRDEVGQENIHIFGLTRNQVKEFVVNGDYNPIHYYNENDRLRNTLDSILNGTFCPEAPDLFEWVRHKLLKDGDQYFCMIDFDSYVRTHDLANFQYADRDLWLRKAIMNVSSMGKFSSDRTIAEYAKDIWKV